ncbi:MAG TPA: sulfite exporter TauE/SafE family protein [Bacteroidota bacterium]|nr:sulfite exporter TauE/SafE family protein [Bacteroidota bacterium]
MMDVPGAALLVVAGAAAGFLSGVFAIGDGIVIVPVMLAALHAWNVSSLVATHVAMGTSLAATAAMGLALACAAGGRGQVMRRDAALLAIAGAAAALAAGAIACGLEGTTLRKIFGLLLLAAAVRLFAGKRKSGKSPEQPAAAAKLIPAGLIAGGLSSVSGTGGTVVSVPLLYSYLRIPLRKATGTAHAASLACAAAGAAAYVLWGWSSEFLPPGMHGFVDWPCAGALALGAVPGALAGDRLAEKADRTALRAPYAVALLVVMLRMFFV